MADTATKLPIKTGDKKPQEPPTATTTWHPFESLRREIDRLFDDFGTSFWRAPSRRAALDVEPFWRREWTLSATPAVDIVEKDNAYEVTADLPGMDEKNIEVKLTNGTLTIKGEKHEEKEEKKKDYYLKERYAGSFERSFRVPQGVDTEKVEANFTKGVLKVTLPKTAEAQKPAKNIEVKAA
jgi:HSP20 family protein